jgi:hypothetical protein
MSMDLAVRASQRYTTDIFGAGPHRGTRKGANQPIELPGAYPPFVAYLKRTAILVQLNVNHRTSPRIATLRQ